jgi:hypothetical protein
MEYFVDARSKTKVYIESLLPSMFRQLGLTKTKKFLHILVDNNSANSGACVNLHGIDTYLIVLRSTDGEFNMGVSLAHELTHVSQYVKGLLKQTPKGYKWCGKYYSSNTNYTDMPWEINAFAKQELVWRRAIND